MPVVDSLATVYQRSAENFLTTDVSIVFPRHLKNERPLRYLFQDGLGFPIM